MNAHIINCDEQAFFNTFLPSGYLGVNLVLGGVTPQQLSRACRTSYSMYADMKTIRRGDIIFVHAGETIYGAFKAEGEFVEDSAVNPLFHSRNIHYQPDPQNPASGWRGHVTAIPNFSNHRRLPITHFLDSTGSNLCYELGIHSTEIFNLKNKKRVWSIPERWWYADASRTVRPLMADESVEILKVLDLQNAEQTTRRNITAAALTNYLPIEFILDPAIILDEKIVEGWLLHNIGRLPQIDTALGAFSSFGNNMPAGYLRFMDIFGYQELPSGVKKFKVVEVKVDQANFPEDIGQLVSYMDWVVENRAGGESKLVEGVLVAAGFSPDAVTFTTNYNRFNRTIRLVQFDFVAPNHQTLNITRIV